MTGGLDPVTGAVEPVSGALEIARRVRGGECTAASVLEETRALIETRDAALNCFTATSFERAQREAAAIAANPCRRSPVYPMR